MFFALVGLALRNIRLQLRRLAPLHALVVGSTALIVLLFGIDGGVGQSHRRALTTLLSGEVNVTGFYKVHPDAIALLISDARHVREAVAKEVPEECHWRERIYGHAVLAAGKRRAESFLVGVAPDSEAQLFRLVRATKGNLADLSQSGAIAVSDRVAEKMKVEVGDFITLFASTTFNRRNALDGRVVAITESLGMLGDSAGVLTSMTFLRELYGFQPHALGVLQLECPTPLDTEPLAGKLRTALSSTGLPVLKPAREAFPDKFSPLLREAWYGQKLDVSTWEDEGAWLTFITDGLSALTLIVETLVLIVVIAGIFMALSVSVRERTREMGTMRAIGMQRRHVAFLFFLEGLLTGLIGAVTGGTAGLLLCWVLSGRVELPTALHSLLFQRELLLIVDPSRVVNAVLLVAVGASVGALIPAIKAALAQPKTAMESVL